MVLDVIPKLSNLGFLCFDFKDIFSLAETKKIWMIFSVSVVKKPRNLRKFSYQRWRSGNLCQGQCNGLVSAVKRYHHHHHHHPLSELALKLLNSSFLLVHLSTQIRLNVPLNQNLEVESGVSQESPEA